MARSATDRLRRTVRLVHLWLGLSLGGLLVLAGLTGSALVFYTEIDGWLHPELAVSGQSDPAAYDRAITTVHAAYPDKTGPWRFELTGEGGAIPARYYHPPETAQRDHAPMMVWLSPDGRQVLRRDFWGDTAMTWLYDLHYSLLLGDTGIAVMGYAGLGCLLLLLSGLWAWWPRGSWAKALRFKRPAPPLRRLRDWHKLTGLAGLVPLLLLAATGVMLALPDETEQVLAPAFGPSVAPPAPLSRRSDGVLIAPSQAIALAVRAMPGASPAWIEVPGTGRAAYRMRMRRSGDPSARFPHSLVWVERSEPVMLGTYDATAGTAGTTITNWLHPLHDGSAGGLPLRLLFAVIGLLPLGLFVTGLLRWRRRQGVRAPSTAEI